MSISVDIKGVGELRKSLDEVKSSLITPELLKELADSVLTTVKKRTDRGLDYEKTRFKPYSRGYKKVRRKKGRPTNTVDLRFEGLMLDGMRSRVDAENSEAQIGFGTAVDRVKAYSHHVSGTGKSRVKRKFFGLSKNDKQRLQRMVEAHIEKVLKRG